VTEANQGGGGLRFAKTNHFSQSVDPTLKFCYAILYIDQLIDNAEFAQAYFLKPHLTLWLYVSQLYPSDSASLVVEKSMSVIRICKTSNNRMKTLPENFIWIFKSTGAVSTTIVR